MVLSILMIIYGAWTTLVSGTIAATAASFGVKGAVAFVIVTALTGVAYILCGVKGMNARKTFNEKPLFIICGIAGVMTLVRGIVGSSSAFEIVIIIALIGVYAFFTHRAVVKARDAE